MLLDLLFIIKFKFFTINNITFCFLIFIVNWSHFSFSFVQPGILLSKLVFSWARLPDRTRGILEWSIYYSNGYVVEPDISLASHNSISSKQPKIKLMRFFFFCANPFRSPSLGSSWKLLKDGIFFTDHEGTLTRNKRCPLDLPYVSRL